jgi:hypothetical protein
VDRASLGARRGDAVASALRVARRYAKAIYRRLRPLPAVGDYIPAAETVAAAKAAGQTVEEYVEILWNGVGATAGIVERMRRAGALEPTDTVVEIGPGTGRYLARVRDIVHPRRHVIYETAPDWRAYLIAEYGVESPDANGETLPGVESAGLIHAHGVFVYTPFLVTASYLAEMERAGTGWLVFDFYDGMDDETIDRWLATEHRYPVVLSREWVLSRLPSFELCDEWTGPHGQGVSRYLILRRR